MNEIDVIAIMVFFGIQFWLVSWWLGKLQATVNKILKKLEVKDEN